MKAILTNITADVIKENDRFIVTQIDDCGNVFLRKTTSNTNPCPKWVNVYVNWISWNIPAWCYDGSEFFIGWDVDLIKENIKSWIDIFWVVWNYSWASITWINNILPSNSLSWNTSPWIYNWTQTVWITSQTLLSSNIKNWTNIFWVTWVYKQTLIPSVFTSVWMHVWVTNETTWHTAYKTWAISDNNNLYLCYSMSQKINANSTSFRNVVIRVNWWNMTKILDDSWTLAYTNTAQWFSFRYGDNSDQFIVIDDRPSWTSYTYRTITISTWAVSWVLTLNTTPNSEINQSIYFWEKLYKPIITQTTVTRQVSNPWSNSSNSWLSLNINITDF